ncbi:filamin-binding LIM protein 1-like [Myxocyprinus asiaticus]|uniref:filamin-binding LIM protein 1-like n=1 Tax=Myxocyprinus asiaticus TaxID=70543 RepID=UPI002223A795|nr:filamin-binding LIM protein 1-like [Myxocyprinus asiaticus]XP_051551225.1 filamin-binding LIM protein 1-like [Myxocyprinus asiaticus]
MASAAPQKRMVSSVFITLVSPFKATVTPTPHMHSSPTRDLQQAAVPLRRTSTSSCASAASQDGQSSAPAPVSPLYAQSRPSATNTQTTPTAVHDSAPYRLDNTTRHTDKRSPDVVSSYPPPPSAPDNIPVLPPKHDPCDPRDPYPNPGPPDAPAEVTNAGRTVMAAAPQSSDVCGFCRKPVALSEPAIDALNRTYHEACFQCRQCHMPLAAKMYYNKSGIPLCEDCYQASLEPCWACGDVIKDHVIRALERAYHPPCFVCTTCRQPIGEQKFAQGEVGEVYCLQDYYRKYAPQCSVCRELIIPRDDGTDSFTVECLGHSYHEDCYRCEVCGVLLSPEPNQHGCHPLDGQILCKPCHLTLIQTAQR